jgi:hypothetical protein
MTLREFKTRLAFHFDCEPHSLLLSINEVPLEATKDETKEYLYINFAKHFDFSPLIKVTVKNNE